ncbi:MAG: oligoribonuclease [Pseudomonadota bacterium]
MQDPTNLVWIDLEMTGLDTGRDQIIEIATVITDADLNTMAEGPVIAIHQPAAVIEAMDEWNTRTHTDSGLVQRVRESHYTVARAESETLAFIERHVPAGESPMCGNSICQDRRFMARLMPTLEHYFHYRNLDVSAIKELVQRWKPEIAEGLDKNLNHRALDDVYDSIAELQYYREQVFTI